jgi:hypothetical protein
MQVEIINPQGVVSYRRPDGDADIAEALRTNGYTVRSEFPPRVPVPDGFELECQCARCGSSCHHVDCDQCEEGFSGHDCGEDCCACLYPEENVVCDICRGRGGWWSCGSSGEWCRGNPLPGRESVEPGTIEWFLASV